MRKWAFIRQKYKLNPSFSTVSIEVLTFEAESRVRAYNHEYRGNPGPLDQVRNVGLRLENFF
jgi:hypothetical protein